MLPIAAQGHTHCVDGFDRAHGIALDAGHLHQAADRVARQAEVVFHADLGGVFDLGHAAAQHFAQRTGGHRAGHADFTLAANLGTGDRRVFLVQNPDRGGGEQKAHYAVFTRAGDKAHVVMQHRRHNPGRTVGGRGDHAPAVGVFFVDRQRVQVDPIEYRQRVAQGRLRVLAQLAMQGGGTTLDLQASRQDPFIATASVHTVLHHLPDLQQAVAGFGFGAPGTFIGQHHLADGQPVGGAMTEQVLGALEREGQRRGVFDDPVGAGSVFIYHKATAHRVVLAAADLDAGGVEGTEDHAVGVIGEGFANHRQVFFLVERNAVFAEQVQTAGAAHLCQARGDGFCVHGVRVFAFQAEQHGLVAAVAFAGGAE